MRLKYSYSKYNHKRDDSHDCEKGRVAIEYKERNSCIRDPMKYFKYFKAPLKIIYNRILFENVGDISWSKFDAGSCWVNFKQEKIRP